jgi:hypothetical protein
LIHGLGFLDTLDIVDQDSIDAYLDQLDGLTETAGNWLYEINILSFPFRDALDSAMVAALC